MTNTLIQNARDIVREKGASVMFEFLTAEGMMDKIGVKTHASTLAGMPKHNKCSYFRMHNKEELCVFKWHEIDEEIIFSLRDLKNGKYLGTHGKRHTLNDNTSFAHLETEKLNKYDRCKLWQNYRVELP
jgi:hypothetical protein